MRLPKTHLKAICAAYSRNSPQKKSTRTKSLAEKLLEEAESDLAAIGLLLDQLKIQNVSDNVGYLDSIGRIQSADLQKRARIARANAQANAIKRDAENRMNARIAEANAQIKIARAQTEQSGRRCRDRPRSRHRRTGGSGQSSHRKSHRGVGSPGSPCRAGSTTTPSRCRGPRRGRHAARKVQEAKASAAKIYEDGRATAVLEEMIATWQSGGNAARDIFLMQKLQAVMSSLVHTIQNVEVDKLTILPGSDGRLRMPCGWSRNSRQVSTWTFQRC